MSRTAVGILEADGSVLVSDQANANRLYDKGYAGTPVGGGGLRLSLVEATRLVEEERLVVRDGTTEAPLSFRALFERGLGEGERFEVPFLAYRDLKARGRVVKHANRRSLDFLVFAEGESPPRSRPGWLAGAISERWPATAAALQDWLAEARAEQAVLLLCLLDEEGDLTHYEVSDAAPHGDAPALELPAPVAGELVQDRVMVWDADDAARLHEGHFIGKPTFGGLQLSLVEAAALLRHGQLQVDGFWDRALAVQPDLGQRLAVYTDLRARGMWVKTGFKFGTHFRVYEKHPESAHAPWLAHVIPSDWEGTWPEVSRAVRLAHSVRKTMLLTVVGPADGSLRHIAVRRIRP